MLEGKEDAEESDVDEEGEGVPTVRLRHRYHFKSVSNLQNGGGPLIPSQMKSPNETPEPEAGNEAFYQVDGRLLQKALINYLKEQRKWNWKEATGDEETAWSVRTKWKSDWYH
jgi:hypothetical protein